MACGFSCLPKAAREGALYTPEEGRMQPSSLRKQTVVYTGMGIALGAALGMRFGMMLPDNLP